MAHGAISGRGLIRLFFGAQEVEEFYPYYPLNSPLLSPTAQQIDYERGSGIFRYLCWRNGKPL